MAPATDPNLTRPQAVIVAHGQPSDPAPAEATLRRLAGQVGARLPGWSVDSATLAAPDRLEQTLARHRHAMIYPMFMADGWFTTMALPKRLQERWQRQMLVPLGMDPQLPGIAAQLVNRVVTAKGWSAQRTCLIIAAHGGQASQNPARAARAFTAALADIAGFGDIRLGFIEQAPDLAQIAADTGAQTVCLPFFAANGRHVRTDIPAALNRAGFRGELLDPIGLSSQIPDLIARSLKQNQMVQTPA